MKYDEMGYGQRSVWQEGEEEGEHAPLPGRNQYFDMPGEKILPSARQRSLVSRVLLAIASVFAILIVLQTTLTVHGILYDANMDPAGSTHTFINISFVLFVTFVVLTNILYNRRR